MLGREDMSDRKICCSDCGLEFNFSVKEQEFFEQKGFADPRRCPKCRIKRRELNYGRSESNSSERLRYKARCSFCNQELFVPFEPKSGRLIYCRNCLHKKPTRREHLTPRGGIRLKQ